MTLTEWINGRRAEGSPNTLLTRLAADAGVSLATARAAYKGQPVRNYTTAKAIESATGGVVTALELCEPPQEGAA